MCWGCPGDPEVWWGEWSGFPLLLSCHVTLSSSWCLSGPMLGPKCWMCGSSLAQSVSGSAHLPPPSQMGSEAHTSPSPDGRFRGLESPQRPSCGSPPSGFHFFSGHKVGGKPGRGPPGDPGEGGAGGTSRNAHVLLRRVLSSPLQPLTSCPLRSKQSLL